MVGDGMGRLVRRGGGDGVEPEQSMLMMTIMVASRRDLVIYRAYGLHLVGRKASPSAPSHQVRRVVEVWQA